MMYSIQQLLPHILIALASGLAVAIIARLWYTKFYVAKSEISAMQQSYFTTQNQYMILAERVKTAEALLAEAKEKIAKYEALLTETGSTEKIKEMQDLVQKIHASAQQLHTQSGTITQDMISGPRLTALLDKNHEQLAAKLSDTDRRFLEISGQLWQLMESNNKLSQNLQQTTDALQNAENHLAKLIQGENPHLATIQRIG